MDILDLQIRSGDETAMMPPPCALPRCIASHFSRIAIAIDLSPISPSKDARTSDLCFLLAWAHTLRRQSYLSFHSVAAAAQPEVVAALFALGFRLHFVAFRSLEFDVALLWKSRIEATTLLSIKLHVFDFWTGSFVYLFVYLVTRIIERCIQHHHYATPTRNGMTTLTYPEEWIINEKGRTELLLVFLLWIPFLIASCRLSWLK